MKYKFQSYMDISTSADSLTMIKISAGGQNMLQRVKHLIGAYKYMKMGSISIKLMPASTLPVDPLGLSYASDDPQTVDPRDQMNPGLVRITNGECVLSDFSGLTNSQIEQMYLNTMLDPRWSKFMLQSGFQRHATPLFWNVGQVHQDVFPGMHYNYPADGGGVADVTPQISSGMGEAVLDYHIGIESSPYGLFQTGHRQRIGWLPTDAIYPVYAESTENTSMQPMFMPMPEIDVITVILPKAYKTRYYYRLFITETVYFSGLKNTGIGNASLLEYRAVDNFISVAKPVPQKPSEGKVLNSPQWYNDGSGEGRV